MSDCFSIKHSKYILSFLLLLFSLPPAPLLVRHRHAVIVNEGYCRGDWCGDTCLFGSLLSPPFFLYIKWKLGLDTFYATSPGAAHGFPRPRPCWVCAAVQKANFHSGTREQQRRINQREYRLAGTRAWFLPVTRWLGWGRRGNWRRRRRRGRTQRKEKNNGWQAWLAKGYLLN